MLPWGFRPSHPLVGANASQNCRALGVGSSLLGSLLEGVCPLPRIPAASCAGPGRVALRFSVPAIVRRTTSGRRTASGLNEVHRLFCAAHRAFVVGAAGARVPVDPQSDSLYLYLLHV